jgi:hypothetical protein
LHFCLGRPGVRFSYLCLPLSSLTGVFCRAPSNWFLF